MSSDESDEPEHLWYTEGEENIGELRAFVATWPHEPVKILFRAVFLNQPLSFKWLVRNRRALPGGLKIDLHERHNPFAGWFCQDFHTHYGMQPCLNIAEYIMIKHIIDGEFGEFPDPLPYFGSGRCRLFPLLELLLAQGFDVRHISDFAFMHVRSDCMLNLLLRHGISMSGPGLDQWFSEYEIWRDERARRQRALHCALGLPPRNRSQNLLKPAEEY